MCKVSMKNIYIILLLVVTNGCTVGHHDFVDYRDKSIGTKQVRTEPYKWRDSGQVIRSDFLVSGEGLTRITKTEHGDLKYHYSDSEILPHFHTKEWVGKCLIYEVVDPTSKEIKGWGFDKGGNPLSCRTWP